MHQLGYTRSSFGSDHLLQTPDTFIRAPLPRMIRATAIVHAAPAAGAAFTQYTAELEPGGCMKPALEHAFAYVLEGEVTTDVGQLKAGSYAYRPGTIRSSNGARVVVIEKPRVGSAELPSPFTARESDTEPESLNGDSAVQVRSFVPEDPAFDFAVNTITYAPGASLPMVEIHYMEHGLIMLEGGGIYRLGERWYPVTQGDFIWMAPYCPQWFGCIGKVPARYLIYKNWNRHPAEEANLG